MYEQIIFNSKFNLMKKFLIVAILMMPFLVLTSCSSDDNNTTTSNASKTYQLNSVSNPDISGTAKFIQNEDGSITVELSLAGTTAGNMHPAHIHVNTALEGGGIAVTLEPVDGATGTSTTTFTELDNTTAVTYAEMVDFDGYINVHLSAADLGTLVAQGDIGQNELTGTSITYALNEVNASGVSGTAVFAQRVNEETLITLSLTGTVLGTDHVTHIHDGSVATAPGAIAITLTTVDGESGISFTNVSQKDDNSPITYTELLIFPGYINIHASETDLAVVAQGDIGSSALN